MSARKKKEYYLIISRVKEIHYRNGGLFSRLYEGSLELNGEDITTVIRQESSGDLASQVAVIPEIREALYERQLAFRQMPGLVADGRDMGTVVFLTLNKNLPYRFARSAS